MKRINIKRVNPLVGSFFFLLILITGIALGAEHCSPTPLSFEHTFYLVCRYRAEWETMATSLSDTVKNSGGAGYIWEIDNDYHVVVACYPDEENATWVCESLCEREETCKVITFSTRTIPLSYPQREEKETLLNSLNTLYAHYMTLYRYANLADDRKMSQLQCQQAVENVRSQLNVLKQEKPNPLIVDSLQRILDVCDQLQAERIKARHLRYLQIEIAYRLCKLAMVV